MTAINMVANLNDSRFGILDLTSYGSKLALLEKADIPEGAEKPVSAQAWMTVKVSILRVFSEAGGIDGYWQPPYVAALRVWLRRILRGPSKSLVP